MVHKSSRNNAKCITYANGKKSPYRARIMRYGKSYSLGRFEKEVEAENMVLIAKTFSDINNFQKWYQKKKEVYNWVFKKCESVDIPVRKIIEAIYDGYYGELYNDIYGLEEFIDDFKIGYGC